MYSTLRHINKALIMWARKKYKRFARHKKRFQWSTCRNIYVKSKRAGERTMASIQRFIEGKLRLKVNEKRSAVDRPWKRKFLGFGFTSSREPKIRIAKESLKRMKKKVREITSRKMPYPMEYRNEKLNQYLIGWCGYFALADTQSIFAELDGWIRRRLRMCLWKNWKKSKKEIRNLINLGVPKWKAYEWGNSRKRGALNLRKLDSIKLRRDTVYFLILSLLLQDQNHSLYYNGFGHRVHVVPLLTICF